MVSLGFDLATMPARMTYRGTRAMLTMPGDIERVISEVREVSDEVAREVQALLYSVDEIAVDIIKHCLGMAPVPGALRAEWVKQPFILPCGNQASFYTQLIHGTCKPKAIHQNADGANYAGRMGINFASGNRHIVSAGSTDI